VAGSTAHVIASLQDESNAAKKRFADPSKIEQELDTVGDQQQANFQQAKSEEWAATQQAYSKHAKRASDLAKQSLSSTNATISEEELDEAEAAWHKMNKAGDKLDAMQKELHDNLQDALNAKLDPELKTADKYSGVASHLQSEAHSTMDPLYSWGDAAESKADSLNDQTNNALSSLEKVVRNYRRQITEHSRAVQRKVQRKVFVGKDGQDRVATWRQLHSLLRRANGHVALQENQASTGLMGLPVMGGLTLLVTATAAAAVGASVTGFVMKSRTPQSSQYQVLSA